MQTAVISKINPDWEWSGYVQPRDYIHAEV